MDALTFADTIIARGGVFEITPAGNLRVELTADGDALSDTDIVALRRHKAELIEMLLPPDPIAEAKSLAEALIARTALFFLTPDGGLIVKLANGGRLTAEERDLIRRHKADLIELLKPAPIPAPRPRNWVAPRHDWIDWGQPTTSTEPAR